jgi:hypothetical protein
MSVTLIVMLATYLVCWQGYKLRERLNGLGHAGILASLVATLLNSTTARLSDAHPHSLLVGQYIALIEHIFVAVSTLGLYLLRLAVEGHSLRDRPVRRAIGGGVLFSCALTAITAAAIISGRLLSPTPDSYRDPLGFVYAFGSGLYYGTILLLVAAWMWRYVRNRDEQHERDERADLRIGVRIAAIGLFSLAAFCFARATPIAVVFLGGPPQIAQPFWVLRPISTAAWPLVFIGLSYPLLRSRGAAYRAWKSRRATREQARVLLRTCHTAYPEIELPPSGIRERARQFVSSHHRLTRLVTEIFDALAKLLVQDEPTNTAAGRVAADRLHEAVRRYDLTHPVPVTEIISPNAGDEVLDSEGVPDQPADALDHDTAFVLDLAAELRTVIDDHRVPA